MNVRELKEIIKDLPDDMEVRVYNGEWDDHQPLWEIKVLYEGDFEFLSIM